MRILGLVSTLAAALLALGTAAATAEPVAADGCSAAPPTGGLVHCSDILDNSLNDISIHILGH